MAIFSRNSYTLAILISLLAHGLLLVGVTWGWQASSVTPRVYTPNFVEAKLVALKPKTTKKPAAKKQSKKIDLAAKRRAQEKKAREAAEKKRRAAEAKAKQEKLKKEKLEKEKQRLAELERQRKLEQQRQQAIEEQLNQALNEEDEMLQAEEDEATAQSYVALISSRIEQNWSRPPSARKGMTCILRLQLVPTGKVVNVSVIKSSGNSAFDRSAEQAVKKAERFPELQNMPPQVFERYFRQLRLEFNPKDLRL